MRRLPEYFVIGPTRNQGYLLTLAAPSKRFLVATLKKQAIINFLMENL